MSWIVQPNGTKKYHLLRQVVEHLAICVCGMELERSLVLIYQPMRGQRPNCEGCLRGWKDEK